jgi:Nucleotidyltransferase domain
VCGGTNGGGDFGFRRFVYPFGMKDDVDTGIALELVRRFAGTYAPDADVVLLAGSRARGDFNSTSDYDVVILYAHRVGGAWREMVRFEGADFEVFVHDLGTVKYFCREVERPSAKPVLATMIVEGVPAVLGDGLLLDEARTICAAMISQGPEALSEIATQGGRYAITNMAQSLRQPVDTSVRIAVGSALFVALSEFVLRSHGRWIGVGKGVPVAIVAMDPKLERRFTRAFASLFEQGDALLVQELVDEVLGASGGRLRAGYKQHAPASWRCV